jgi:hypothetical protein
MIIVKAKSQLPQIALTSQARGRGPDFLDGREQQPCQKGENADDNE